MSDGQRTRLGRVRHQPVRLAAFHKFSHLDFLQNGTVRFDDRSGRDVPERSHTTSSSPCSAGMDITSTKHLAVAHVTLFGTGASLGGTFDYNIKQPNFARQYGAIRLWMGFPWTGSFNMTDLVVTRKK